MQLSSVPPSMFQKILIANRGEIAVRILRACKEMGIATVAVFSEADRDCLHTYLADEAVCVGPAPSSESYLNIQNILSAAVNKKADAIHPGFGFLSENAEFAEICERSNIRFIGPSQKSILLLGDKSAAKRTMQECHVPTIPGSDGEILDFEEAKRVADQIGFPLLIKASAGGGGRGIRLVHEASELETAFREAASEAKKYFGNPAVYIEKLLQNTRHIEFQILADHYGNIIHLGERDCSMQRRRQKLLEETPSVAVDAALRARMGEAAVNAAKAVGYQNTGTVEFLLTPEGEFYFMEMNTRIQVEHPVTEMVTGLDLIKEQIRIASGQPLTLRQEDVQFRGHAIECRINAEDANKNFMPTGGTFSQLHIPGGPGVRFDSQLYTGYTMPMYYDSMIGKLIVHAPTREEAIARMQRALSEMIIDGVVTNTPFQQQLLNFPAFQEGQYSTSSIEEMFKIC